MASSRIGEQIKQTAFQKDFFQALIYILISASVAIIVLVGVIVYQVVHKPIPVFYASNPAGQSMGLTPYNTPNLMSDTLITWASKAAVSAYTFDFDGYTSEIELAKPYFTPAGWTAYQAGISTVADRVFAQKLFVNGVVSGPPVISNQGELPGHGYSWRIQIPFLVTYQSAEKTEAQSYYVSMTIVKVPTTVNPQGIGIEQFEMTK